MDSSGASEFRSQERDGPPPYCPYVFIVIAALAGFVGAADQRFWNAVGYLVG
jgi:hypothetical protein